MLFAEESVNDGGINREAVSENSPGPQPWDAGLPNTPCLSAVGLGRWDEGGKAASEGCACRGLVCKLDQLPPIRLPLSGHLFFKHRTQG
jgi:hypothetical protein